MSDEDKLRVYVCSNSCCGNKELYASLKAVIDFPDNPLPVILKEKSCLGGCSYGNRVNVEFPNGYLELYAKDESEIEAFIPVKAMGNNPLKTIIEDNLVQLAKRKV